uniref:Putative HNH homing endonuclease n=1 Tax=viral metagenome TaxID=1070528 RepID=A0A6H1ZPG5_9ZZZZ
MSDSSNKKKTAQLGMPYGTAANKLKKSLLFAFAHKLGLATCFRCGDMLRSVDSFSVEHKEAWLDSTDPIKKFFDINNIAFSHLECNSGAGKRPTKYTTEGERHAALLKSWAKSRKANRTPETRRAQYLRTGK